MRASSASIAGRSASGRRSTDGSPPASKASLSMRMISTDSLLTIDRVSRSQSTGTVILPV